MQFTSTYFYLESYTHWYNWFFGFWFKWEECDDPIDNNHVGYSDKECVGIRIFGLELWYVRPKASTSEYACDCGWHCPEEPYYIAKDGKSSNFCKFKEFNEETRDLIYEDTPNGELEYPRYEDYQYSNWGAQEFGGNPHDWNEVHYCPHCKEEFGYSNSNY